MAVVGLIALGFGLYFGGIIAGRDVVEMRGKDAGALFSVSLPDTAGREQSLG